MLFADGGWTDPDVIARFINQVGFPIALITLAAVVLIIFLWKYAPTYRENAKAQTRLYNMIAEHYPEVTQTLERLASRTSDIFDSQIDIAHAISAAACPENKKSADAHLARVFRRKQREDKRRSAAKVKKDGDPEPNGEPEQEPDDESENG